MTKSKSMQMWHEISCVDEASHLTVKWISKFRILLSHCGIVRLKANASEVIVSL